MPGTFLPLVVCPDAVWTTFPFALTLEGQYIVKNAVLIGGALVLFGRLPADAARDARRPVLAWSRRGVRSALAVERVAVGPRLLRGAGYDVDRRAVGQ